MVASALTKSLSVLQPLEVFTFHENEGNIKVLLLVKHLLQVFFLPGRVLSSPHISVHFSFATALSQSCGVNCANSRQYIFVLVGGSFEKLEISF